MILLSNILKTNVTEFRFLLRSHAFKAVTYVRWLIYLQRCWSHRSKCLCNSTLGKKSQAKGHTFKCPQCWQNCLLRKRFLFNSQKLSGAGAPGWHSRFWLRS